MHPEIQDAVESAYRHEREQGFVSLDALRSDAIFVAAELVAEAGSIEVLADCPDWLVRGLHDWVRMYRENGRFGFVSNLGESDHSSLLAKVSKVLARWYNSYHVVISEVVRSYGDSAFAHITPSARSAA